MEEENRSADSEAAAWHKVTKWWAPCVFRGRDCCFRLAQAAMRNAAVGGSGKRQRTACLCGWRRAANIDVVRSGGNKNMNIERAMGGERSWRWTCVVHAWSVTRVG